MKRRLDLRLALFLLAIGLAARAQPVLIRAGKLVDPATGTASTAQQILIEGGVIRAVGQKVAAPAGAQVVDLSDRTVLPGLMDAHTHLCLTVVDPGRERAERAAPAPAGRDRCWRPTPGARSSA